jgi:hypothetical protein
MVEPQPSKLMAWVRFPSPAPNTNDREAFVEGFFFYFVIRDKAAVFNGDAGESPIIFEAGADFQNLL